MKRLARAAAVILASALLCAGCADRPRPVRYLSDDDSSAQPPPKQADLSLPFRASAEDISMGEDAGLPVAAARALALSSGGAWVALAPDALDPVKGFDQTAESAYAGVYGRQQNPVSVSAAIDRFRAAGSPISYDTSRGYVFLVFGPQDQLDKMRAAPPDPVMGLMVAGNDPQSAISALADARREKIDLDPQLAASWTNYTQRNTRLTAEMQKLEGDGPMAYAESLGKPAYPGQFIFQSVRRLPESDLMQALARTIGGQATQIGDKTWRIGPYSPQSAFDAEIKRIKSVLPAATPSQSGESAGAGTSYAERRQSLQSNLSDIAVTSEPSASPNSSESISAIQSQIQELSKGDAETTAAVDELGMIGDPALATLKEYLTPGSASSPVTAGVLRALAAEAGVSASARDAVYQFAGDEMKTAAKPGGEMQRAAIIGYMVDLLSAMASVDGQLDSVAQDALGKAATRADVPQFIRDKARDAMLRFGVTPHATGSAPAWNPAAETTFTLTAPLAGPGLLRPVTQESPGAIRPLASVALPSGEAWAVFSSDRYGDQNDLWLAHATGGAWKEFLFTGKKYQTSESYSYRYEDGPHPGDCALTVDGDRVVIKPAGANEGLAVKIKQWTASITKDEMSKNYKQMQQISAQLQQAEQKAGNALIETYVLSLADLRRDSDGDGLTDIAEARLGTDPKNRDTPSAGSPDGTNQNPLVKRDAGSSGNADVDSDRRALLQKIFDAYYGNDTLTDPVVIVIDKRFQQAFHGGAGRVLCLTPAEYASRGSDLSSLRCLEFGGPTDGRSTILAADGPCLYSADNSRAEVHFWFPQQAGMPSYYARALQQSSDYVAIFERSGSEWTLKSIDRLRFRSSQSSPTAPI